MENQTNTSTEESSMDSLILSLNVLIKAAVVGQKNGSYTLNEASTIFESIKFIQEKFGKKEEESKEESKEEVTNPDVE